MRVASQLRDRAELAAAAMQVRLTLRVDPLEFYFMLCDDCQPLVPSPLELADNQPIAWIDCVELPLGSGGLEARLFQQTQPDDAWHGLGRHTAQWREAPPRLQASTDAALRR